MTIEMKKTNRKHFLLIEDDQFHIDVITRRLEQTYRGSEFDIYSTEKAFLAALAEKTAPQYDLAIIDQTIPYTTVDDPDPVDKATKNALRGGWRCYMALREKEPIKTLPVLFYTILDEQSVPDGAAYVPKSGDPELTDLIAKVSEMLSARVQK